MNPEHCTCFFGGAIISHPLTTVVQGWITKGCKSVFSLKSLPKQALQKREKKKYWFNAVLWVIWLLYDEVFTMCRQSQGCKVSEASCLWSVFHNVDQNLSSPNPYVLLCHSDLIGIENWKHSLNSILEWSQLYSCSKSVSFWRGSVDVETNIRTWVVFRIVFHILFHVVKHTKSWGYSFEQLYIFACYNLGKVGEGSCISFSGLLIFLHRFSFSFILTVL